MRFVSFIVLCLFFSACNNGDSNHRGYVISKANETTVEAEAIMEQPPE